MLRKDLNLPGFSIKKVSGYNPLILDVYYRRKPRCLFCEGKRLRKKAAFIRQVRHELMGQRLTFLRFKAHKL
ncbi:MAG: hypothetical protein K0S27_516 [Gammaproteobacteria bacterium]|jgi:hypothetical protein|nr:hypothetical protein [Gammaproteobacteria bacterium]